MASYTPQDRHSNSNPPLIDTGLLSRQEYEFQSPVTSAAKSDGHLAFARGGLGRRALGILLLLVVVVLWTSSNFLASTIFADSSFSKPFFVTYLNTSFFSLAILPSLTTRLLKLWRTGRLAQVRSFRSLLKELDDRHADHETRPFLYADHDGEAIVDREGAIERHALQEGKLGFKDTARLSFEFCLLWFTANYFAFACLQHTTVASTTILTSTSGVWTLIFGAFIRIERLTLYKLLGVFISLCGVIVISRVDVSGSNEPNRGNFPDKPPAEIALGDFMAAFSAVLYGVYTIVMKKRVGDEDKVNMTLFFGLVGIINALVLWPGFLVLHWTGYETFELPDTNRIWIIIAINATISLLSDICWAYSLLLTTPLIVTVGLSLTIPLSLIGQIIIQGQYVTATYGIGAAIVFLSFIIVNYEGKNE